jgi:hypothetical protein
MAKNGIMSVAVSNDRFHPPLDPDIKRWFTKKDFENDFENDFRAFHGPTTPIKIGRSKTGIKACCCEGPFINPKGDIYHCGCPKSPKIGDVWKGIGDWDVSFDTCGLIILEMEKEDAEDKARSKSRSKSAKVNTIPKEEVKEVEEYLL